MKTSYFAKTKNYPKGVSIARKAPFWYKGRTYQKLAPKYWFFKKYKKDGDEKFYEEQYYKEVLDKLDPKQVYEELGEEAILLCWEKPVSFCHRHIVAEWLNKNLNLESKITEIATDEALDTLLSLTLDELGTGEITEGLTEEEIDKFMRGSTEPSEKEKKD
jgi:hypothetical protein